MVDDLIVLRGKLEIFPAERADDKPGIDAEHFHQSIGHQPGTGNQRRGLILAALAGVDDHAAGVFFQGADFGVVDDGAAFRFEVLRHRRRHVAVADDAAGRDEDPAEPGNVRFALAQLPGAQPFPLQAVGGGAIPQGAHPLHLQRRGGDQHLAADVIADAVLLAKGLGSAVAGEAKLRLEAAGGVIHPGVDHAAVVAGLMAGRAGLFFQQRNAGVRVNLN